MTQFIKQTEEEQLQQLAALAAEIWREHYLPIIGEQQLEYMVQEFQSPAAIARQIEEGMEYYAIALDGKAVGYLGLEEKDGLFISKYYIHEDARGQGIGRSAMQWIEALAAERGLGRLWLKCNRYNSKSLAVYGRLGFAIVGEEDGDLGHGYVAEDFVLEKKLGDV